MDLDKLKKEYNLLKKGKDDLLLMIYESELPEMVYNSNAIENSSLTLAETEKILLEQAVMKETSLRETYEAVNLARIIRYLYKKPNFELSIKNIELLHQMLLGGINDSYAGRVRAEGEYVRVGSYIAPAPQKVKLLLNNLIIQFNANLKIADLSATNIVKLITNFHLEFENIHPFNDGNGRIGRVLINLQLLGFGFPPIIIPFKSKQIDYYSYLADYHNSNKDKGLYKKFELYLSESLNKRIAYLQGKNIINLSDYAKINGVNQSAITNKAKRQSVPAFHIRDVWKIAVS
ncbi:MAG: Fic family protein [Bifidobacteriaceae bacterium]|jgi:Fic family protein|nr:Fic family protein [Bifidobacteriaceae bacterium]